MKRFISLLLTTLLALPCVYALANEAHLSDEIAYIAELANLGGCSANRTASTDSAWIDALDGDQIFGEDNALVDSAVVDELIGLKIDRALTELQYTELKDQFNINYFSIDSTYTTSSIDHHVAQGNTFTSPTLIGYNANHIYLMHYEEDDVVLSRIDYIAKHIERDMYRSKADIWFSGEVVNGVLYWGEAFFADGGLHSVLKRFHIQNRENQAFEEIVFQNTYPRLPAISYSDDYVVINYATQDKYILGYMNHSNNQFNEIIRSSYEIDEGYLYTGDIPLFGNGDDQGIYFQIISLNKESIDFEGSQILYYYTFAEGVYTPVLHLSDKTVHVSGSGQTVILEDYSVNSPRGPTGKIISLEDNTVITLPEINPVNNIKHTNIKNKLFFISSIENISVYNYDQQTFSSMGIDSFVANRNAATLMKIYENTFGLIDFSDELNPVFILVQYSAD